MERLCLGVGQLSLWRLVGGQRSPPSGESSWWALGNSTPSVLPGRGWSGDQVVSRGTDFEDELVVRSGWCARIAQYPNMGL